MKRDVLDDLFSRYIRLLADGTCERCHKKLGLTKGLHCGHFQSRGKLSVRFDRDNARCFCYGCHRYLDQHPAAKAEFFLEKLGKERFEALCKRAETPAVGKNKLDREFIKKDLKEKIHQLEGGI